MALTSVTWSPPVQWGTASAGVWTDSNTIGGLIADIITGGMVFDAKLDQTLRFQSGFILDGPVVASFVLQCDTRQGGVGPVVPHTLEFGIVPDAQPVDYSNAALPWTRGEVSLGTFTVTTALASIDTTLSFTLSGAFMAELRAQSTSRSRWNGRTAISVRSLTSQPGASFNLFSTGLNVVANAATTQELFFAGLTGGPPGKVRAVRDGRYAMPAFNTELIRDGDNPGLWVRPFDFDPEDEEATYRPRPGEGTVDDEIPNL